MLRLEITKRTDSRLLKRMENHYSQPKGFVGRNICYAIYYNEIYYGHIVWGSATKHLPGRHTYLNTSEKELNSIANNLFYNISKVDDKYPKRNFTSFVLNESIKQLQKDWYLKYKCKVVGLETLVEKPRTGELYLKSGFEIVGETKGFTCKRVRGYSSEKWGGKRVWNKDPNTLRPKIVLCKRIHLEGL
jgi:hypothetical protein